MFAVKKAYHKLSLKWHPDLCSEEEEEEATCKFETLGRIYAILSDEEKREVYDDSGIYLYSVNVLDKKCRV